MICRQLPVAFFSALALAGTAAAGDAPGSANTESAYSSLDLEQGCTVLDRPPEGEPGEWVRMVCQGYRGYPVFYVEGDLRVSMAYGFPVNGAPKWQSFSRFNRVHSKIEWRLASTETGQRPFATIHRWYVHAGDEAERPVLVIHRVAQPDDGTGCVVAYVDAQANEQANKLARRIADEHARDFRCGSDTPRFHGDTTNKTPEP